MTKIRFLPIVFLAVAGQASAADHVGASPAAHMEIKDGSGMIVCFVYDTDSSVAPIASDCPDGMYTEQLFDRNWSMISQRAIRIGGEPDTAGMPVRVEETCVLDSFSAFYENVTGGSVEDNLYPSCAITCDSGVVISANASGTLGTDNSADYVSFTPDLGLETARVYVITQLTFGFIDDPEGAAALDPYVIAAQAVCL